MRLRLHTDENPDDAPAPIPFPRDRVAPGRDAGGAERPKTDRTDRVEDALEDIQRNLDELGELLDSLPFPSSRDDHDDGPCAA